MEPILAAAKTWQLHPFVDHFTVALILIGIATDFVATLFSSRLWIRYMALSLMILGAAGAFASNVTGGWEAHRVWEAVHGPAKALLRRHAEIGDYLPWAFLVLAIWRIGVQFAGFLRASRPIYLIVAALSAGAIIYQGRLGGELVYSYGIGTAVMPVSAVSAPVAPEAAPKVAPPASSPPVEAPPVEAPPPVPGPMPTVFVPPSAAATPAAPPPAAMKPTPQSTPAAPAGPGAAPVAGVTPEAAPSPAAAPAEAGAKNL